jgi:hypothetical protein
MQGSEEQRRATAHGAMQVDIGGFCFAERNAGGAAVADVDGDMLSDIYVTNMNGRDFLMRNMGDSRFEDVAKGSGLDGTRLYRSNGVALGDVDNDGDIDIFITTIASRRYYMHINDGTGHFTEEAVGRHTAVKEAGRKRAGMSAAFGDFDGDAYLDLHITEWLPHFLRDRDTVSGGFRSSSRLLRNRGPEKPGYFEDVTDREQQIGGSGGSLEPPGPLLEPLGPLLTHLHTFYMGYSERLPSRLNPLAERTCFSQ